MGASWAGVQLSCRPRPCLIGSSSVCVDRLCNDLHLCRSKPFIVTECGMMVSMRTTCEWCGAKLQIPARGRSPRFCSTRCRVASHRAHKLPDEMTDAARWTRCDGKRPVRVDGRPASSTDSVTWSAYADVKASSAGDGFGVMLGDGLGCYDLDGVTDEQARDFAATVPERVLFVERSVSGKGVHVFFEGAPERGWRRVIDGMKVERYTTGRFIRMTGQRM